MMAECAHNGSGYVWEVKMDHYNYTEASKPMKTLDEMYKESLIVIPAYQEMLDAIYAKMMAHKRFVMEYQASAA